MSQEDHVDLLTTLCGLKGMVAVSGYPSKLYDDALKGWERHERKHYADGASPRREVLWMNQAMVARLGHGALFETLA